MGSTASGIFRIDSNSQFLASANAKSFLGTIVV